MELFFLFGSLFLPLILFRPRDVFQPEFFINFVFIILIGLGPIVLFFFRPDAYHAGQHGIIAIIIALGYLSINCGFLTARLLYKNKARSPAEEEHRKSWMQRNSSKLNLIGILIFILSLSAGTFYFLRAGQIPLFSDNKEAARVAAMSFSGNGYLLYLFTLGVLAPAFILMHQLAQKGLRALISPLFLAITLTLAALLLFTGSRRYSIWLFIYALGTFHYTHARIPIRSMILVSLLGLLFINIFEMFRNPESETTESIATAFAYRFLIYGANLEKIFSIFSEHQAMLGSTFLMDVMTILPGRQVDYQMWLKDLAGLDFEGFGLPPTIMGDLYINFGYPGVILGGFLSGIVLRILYIRLITHGKSGLGILFYLATIEISTKTVMSGISAQSITMLWLSSVFITIAFFIKILQKRRIN